MHFIYNQIIWLASLLLRIVALFSPKIKLFVPGRQLVFETITSKIKATDQTIWFHAASLGEYEQGLPVMEEIKNKYPNHKIVLSFFSPSGYEVRKNNPLADVTVYLPLDTKKNAQKFIEAVHPEMVFFIKYEFWINYLYELKKQSIPTYLISGIFREKQLFFKWYGGFYRKALESFAYFFVQNQKSKQLLLGLGKTNVMVSGDTRFDRVLSILEKDNRLDYIEKFKNNTTTVVVGSSWPKDESVLIEYINSSPLNVKFIIAPHNIKKDQIEALQNKIVKKTVLFTEKGNKNVSDYQVFVIDTIGILTKIYSYGDIAYVGGGFGNPGVHNILEPATFGIPIIIGPNYSHFAEAVDLVALKGCLVIDSTANLKASLDRLLQDSLLRNQTGAICKQFILDNYGATKLIVENIKR